MHNITYIEFCSEYSKDDKRETSGQHPAFVWEGAVLQGEPEASSAVLKATMVTRTPERRLF